MFDGLPLIGNDDGEELTEREKAMLEKYRAEQAESGDADSEESDEDERSNLDRLVEETSKVEARRNRNKASQNHSKFSQEAEKHQQKVYEYIKEGSQKPPSERIPLALEAKIEQFNAAFARLRSFKGLKNQLIWRYIEVMKEFRERTSMAPSQVDVPLSELDGELGQLSTQMQDMSSTIQAELQEALDVMQSFEFQDGGFEVQAGDILQEMEEFDEQTTPDDFAGIDMQVSDTGAITTDVDSHVQADGGDQSGAMMDVDGAMGIDDAINQMSQMADQADTPDEESSDGSPEETPSDD